MAKTRQTSMASPQQLLEKARQSHHAGDYKTAEALYSSLLKSYPRFTPALHMVGILYAQQNQMDKAAQYVKQALQQEPRNPSILYTLGNILQSTQQWDKAIETFKQVVAIEPANANAFCSIGNIFYETGRFDMARDCARYAVRLDPKHWHSHNMLGVIYASEGQHDLALHHYQAALAAKPDYAEAANNLGNFYKKTGDFAAAEAAYHRSIQADPGYAIAYNGLGVLFNEMERKDDAEHWFRQAIEKDPSYVEAYNNLGNLIFNQDRVEEADVIYDKALAVNPRSPVANFNKGTLLAKKRLVNEALDYIEKAIALDPDYVEAYWNHSVMSLMKGDYATGWREHDYRLRLKEFPKRPFNKPAWQGEPLQGKRILVLAEQGFGDTLQFVRYLRLVKAQGGTVIFECQKELKTLLANCPYIDAVVTQGTAEFLKSGFDVYVYLLSLPGIFKTERDSIPEIQQDVVVTKSVREKWRLRLSGYEGRKIGIVWACHSASPTCNVRTVGWDGFQPLFGVAGNTFFSLQKGNAALSADTTLPENLVDLAPEIGDFQDTAAIIQCLDLVITVDTAVAHLAGLLNVPTWALIPHESDWRWLRDTTASPWYPSLRLFRQESHGDWPPVVEAVIQALQGQP